MGPYRIVRYVYGNKFEVMEPNTNITLVIHSDRLKKMPSCSDSPLAPDSVPKEQADTHLEQVTQQAFMLTLQERSAHFWNVLSIAN